MYLLKKSCKLFCLLIIGVFITSCTDEINPDELAQDLQVLAQSENALHLLASPRSGDSTEVWSAEDEGYDDCFEFVYPIEISFPDGDTESVSTESVSTEDELEQLIETWYDANPDATAEPIFIYPLEILIDSSETRVIQSEEELCEIILACEMYIEGEEGEEGEDGEDEDDEEEDDFYGEEDFEDCFDLIFPVEIIFPDGSITSITTEDELEDMIEAWYDTNPNATEAPAFVFPIEVTTDSTETILIQTETQLDELISTCEPDDEEDKD